MSDQKDHREIGKELELFSFHEEAPGAVFWHHKGYIIYKNLVQRLRKLLDENNYQEIYTPVMTKTELFLETGHWQHYGGNMFSVDIGAQPFTSEEIEIENEIGRMMADKNYRQSIKDKFYEELKNVLPFTSYTRMWPFTVHGEIVYRDVTMLRVTDDNHLYKQHVPYSLKPMNCPEAALVYKTKIRSYNDLPLRLAEFGILHRNELSGVLGGLFRVRQFTIDDAHHFIRPSQIQSEIKNLLKLVVTFYNNLGFHPEFYLSTKPEKAMGDPKLWEKAENDLKSALDAAKVKYGIKNKDGAFYGPKIDIHIKDSQNRDWQLATIQLDFQIPEKMKLTYADERGFAQRPVIVHRAILGSVERFIAIITEHFQGAFPFWISPIQIEVLTISDKYNSTAKKVYKRLINKGFRVKLNNENKMLGAKIRESTLQKVPYMVIIGDKEAAVKPLSVSVRTREGKDLGLQELTKFIKDLESNIEKFQ